MAWQVLWWVFSCTRSLHHGGRDGCAIWWGRRNDPSRGLADWMAGTLYALLLCFHARICVGASTHPHDAPLRSDHLSRRYDERQAGSDHRTGDFARAARSPNGGGSVCPRRSLLCALARSRLGCYARISPVPYPQLSPGVAQQLVCGTPV
jgi:hypothetical protein